MSVAVQSKHSRLGDGLCAKELETKLAQTLSLHNKEVSTAKHIVRKLIRSVIFVSVCSLNEKIYIYIYLVDFCCSLIFFYVACTSTRATPPNLIMYSAVFL